MLCIVIYKVFCLMESTIIKILSEFVNNEDIIWDEIDKSASLVEMGILDSMDLTQVLLEIESISKKNIDYSELDFETAFSIEGLEKLISG